MTVAAQVFGILRPIFGNAKGQVHLATDEKNTPETIVNVFTQVIFIQQEKNVFLIRKVGI